MDLKENWEKERNGIGSNKTISISKTIKITASKKNRKEKGIRALFLGSNPHSKGEHFSRSCEDREEITRDKDKTTDGMIIANIDVEKERTIRWR